MESRSRSRSLSLDMGVVVWVEEEEELLFGRGVVDEEVEGDEDEAMVNLKDVAAVEAAAACVNCCRWPLLGW